MKYPTDKTKDKALEQKLLTRIKWLVLFFIVAVAISGITAFPVYTELQMIKQRGMIDGDGLMATWLSTVYNGVIDTYSKYPFLFYGYDWLAFAHLMIAALFFAVYKNPVKNKFIVDWGIFCCIAIVPMAVIGSSIRGIPFFHTLVDCSFGALGLIPLIICRKYILILEKMQTA